MKQDPDNGNYEAYAGEITIPVPLKAANEPQNLKVDYQGCSESGFCYPPMHKSFAVDLANNQILTTGANQSFKPAAKK